MTELIGLALGFFLTIMVASYIFGDNALFRLAVHIFIGVAAGYAVAAATYSVILPQLVVPLLRGGGAERLLAAVFLLSALLLLTKIWPRRRISALGSFIVAGLVGIGAATAIGGAVLGTIFPQSGATIDLFGPPAGSGSPWGHWALALTVLVGALTTLVYFQFYARPNRNGTLQRGGLVEGLAWVGQIFIAITFGTLFAGVYAAALAAFVERGSSIMLLFQRLLAF